MKWTRVFSVILLLSVLVGTASQVIAQAAFDTAFTCRGFLKEHAMPVGQDKDFRFTLFDVDHSDPNHQIGGSNIVEDVEVDRGHFIVDVDFGAGPFTGEARWLLIEVRDWDSIDPADFVEQDPLIRLTLSPYAIRAREANTAPGVVPQGGIIMWSGLLTNIPAGWALCDGGTYIAPDDSSVRTPNLTARFIRSVPDSATDPGRTGGSTSGHTHGGGSYSAASHTHTFSGTTDRTDDLETAASDDEQVCARITHTHEFSGITGSGAGGAISGTSGEASGLPPFFELAFIMRL